MMNLKNLLAKLLLAVLFMSGAGHALAGPTYSVSIDTSTLGSGPAYLGLYFAALDGAAQATATVDNLAGDFVGQAALTGPVTGLVPGPLVFGNADGGSELVQGITLGGMFSFDLSFILGTGDIGSTFAWALFNDVAYLGADGDLGSVSVQPGAAAGGVYLLADASTLGRVQVIPEPSTIALLLFAGFAMLVAARRRC